MTDPRPPESESHEFSRQLHAKTPGLIAELWDFLRHNQKWWLLPILIMFALLGVLVFLSSSVVAPFIYPIF